MKNKKVSFIVTSAVVAALYVVLTYLAAAFGLASNVIQVRFSEALTILPIFTPAAIPGLFVGCIVANALTGAVIFDVIFGSIATLIGAIGAWLIGKYAMKKFKHAYFFAPLPTIVANSIIVPLVLRYAYGLEDAMWYMVLTVGAGEVISAGILGVLLYLAFRKNAQEKLYRRSEKAVRKACSRYRKTHRGAVFGQQKKGFDSMRFTTQPRVVHTR